MDRADIRSISGDQGEGKSVTGVAYPVDDYFAHAEAVSPDGKWRLPIYATYPEYLCRTGDGKIVKKPKDWRIESPVKIFANFHLYGIKYRYVDVPLMLEFLNSGLFKDGWFLIDESFITDKRNSMTLVGKIIAFFGATIRKRGLHLLLMTQYRSMLDLRFRAFATTRILCSYDPRTKFVTLEINKKGDKKNQSVSYYARQYWRYYKTDEIIPIPEHILAKAKEMIKVEG